LALPDQIELARRTGWDGLAFDVRAAAELAERVGVARVRTLFEEAGVRPGNWGLPVAWQDDDRWQGDLRALPRLAALAVELGCDRATTWMPSGSNVRAYEANREWHVARFRPIAAALAAAGCRLGIEFIGPATYRAKFRYPFIYTLGELMELAGAIETGNVGVLLDAWHVYTSGGTNAEVAQLSARDVVLVHVNDAPSGVARDEQDDHVRRLPMATGVIDLPGFMAALRTIGYDGPVTPEPFDAALAARAAEDPEGAAVEAAGSMAALWRESGLSPD
jgi:sugar phosphate isomerase/epimerase